MKYRFELNLVSYGNTATPLIEAAKDAGLTALNVEDALNVADQLEAAAVAVRDAIHNRKIKAFFQPKAEGGAA